MKTTIFLFAVLIFPLCFFCFCKGPIKTTPQETIITKIDMEEMALRHLSDFNLIRERPKGSTGTEYVFIRESDSVRVSMTVGLHPSANDAEDIALDFLHGIALVMVGGPIQGDSIGDKLWWYAPTSDLNNVRNIVFIRKNALFIMSCSYRYTELPILAKAIDDDIVKGESYITIENSISP